MQLDEQVLPPIIRAQVRLQDLRVMMATKQMMAYLLPPNSNTPVTDPAKLFSGDEVDPNAIQKMVASLPATANSLPQPSGLPQR